MKRDLEDAELKAQEEAEDLEHRAKELEREAGRKAQAQRRNIEDLERQKRLEITQRRRNLKQHYEARAFEFQRLGLPVTVFRRHRPRCHDHVR